MFTSVSAEVTNTKFKQRNLDQSCSKAQLHSTKCETTVCQAQASNRTQGGGGS
jgi:hypothetical protein